MYNQVETIYGIGYINSLISNLKKQMNNLEYTQIPIDETKISKENYNYQGNFASDTYLNILYKIQALEILKEGRGLASQTYFPVYDDLNKADYKPSQTERELLVRFQTNLQKNLTRLIHSKREDWGYAMLIGMARFLVINKSLEENKLYFLDCFGNSYFLIKKKVISNLKHHKKLKHDSYRLFEEAKSLFFSDLGTNFELDYQLLEDVANRYEELRNGINKFIPVRSISGKLIPQKTGVVSLFHKFPSRDKIEANLKIAKENETKYQKKLQEIYDYHLINNNCTTEVFTYLNSAFHFSQKESEKRLGGFIQGNDLFVFVPFYAYYKVGKSYNVKSSKEILSVRRKMVKKFAEKGNEFWVKLRESNTITSKIYQFNPDDSWFVFFTDDTIIFRPFMGFVNLLVGVTETGYGIFQFPLDKGDRLLKGLKGTFFSLPELAFFNIRKGTFSILDKDKLEWLQKEAKEELNRSD